MKLTTTMNTIRQNYSTLFFVVLLAFAVSQTLVAQDKDGDKKKPASKAEVCKPHKIAKDQCFICDPKLREKGRLWCKEHERYENRCWVCHPEAQDKKRLFCKEHSLYEDECFICHPELKKKPADKAK